MIDLCAKPSLVAYLTAGDSSRKATYDIALAATDNGAQFIEFERSDEGEPIDTHAASS